MQAYVREKNQAVQKDARLTANDAESLKVPLPDLERAKDHKRVRNNHRPSTQHVREQRRSSKDGKSARELEPGVVVDGIQDNITDDNQHAGAMEKRGAWKQLRTDTILPHLDADDMAEFEDIDDYAGGFQYQLMGDQQAEAMKQRLVRGYQSIDKYIEGDSYPDTTSGRLSDDDPTVLDAFHGRATQDTPALPQDRPATQVERYAAPSIPQFFRRSDELDLNNVPAFQMPMVRRTVPTKRPSPAQQRASKERDVQVPSSHERRLPVEPPSMHKPSGHALARPEMHQMNTPQHIATTIEPGQTINDHDHAHNARAGNDTSNTGLRTDGVSQTSLLDCNSDDLRKKEYKDLLDEQFDHDPVARVTRADTDESLHTKLDSLITLSPDEWSEFFYSLDMREWETAGDWFIDGFSSTLKSLKDIRHQRRDAALAFEQEVEKRHKAVVQKRIGISNAMKSMRAHGAQVLITPAKTS